MKDFEIENEILTKYNGSADTVTIPKGVTVIGEYAFFDNNLKVIDLNGVAIISYRAFVKCTHLTQLLGLESVKVIKNWAFTGCHSIVDLNFGAGLTSIGEFAFYLCKGLRRINLPAGIDSIGDMAFAYNEFATIEIANKSLVDKFSKSWNVNFNGSIIYKDCSQSLENESVNREKLVQEKLVQEKLVQEKLVQEKLAKEKSVPLSPEEGPAQQVPKSGSDFIIRDNVVIEYLGNSKHVLIPSGVFEIGEAVFKNNTAIEQVSCRGSLKVLGKSSFEGSSIRKIIMPGVQTIGDRAFFGCHNFIAGSDYHKLIKINKFAFAKCPQLNMFNIADNVIHIGEGAFSFCSNVQLSVASANEIFKVEDNVLLSDRGETLHSYCNRLNIFYTIPSSVKNINMYAFSGGRGLRAVNINNPLDVINNYAFYKCEDLMKIIICSKVDAIGKKICHADAKVNLEYVAGTIPATYEESDCRWLVSTSIQQMKTSLIRK